MARPSAPPITTRATATVWLPRRALRRPARGGERDQHDRDARRYAPGGRREQDRQQGQHGAEGERERRGPGGLPGAGEVFGVDGQFGVEVGGERVVLGEFVGDRARVSGRRPFASYRAASSASSSSGSSRSSRFSVSSWAFSESRWLDTDTYSPRAIDTAPATRPAMPAVNSGPRSVVTPATPTTSPATDTMPSLARAPRPAASSAGTRSPRRGSRRGGGGRRVPARGACGVHPAIGAWRAVWVARDLSFGGERGLRAPTGGVGRQATWSTMSGTIGR